MLREERCVNPQDKMYSSPGMVYDGMPGMEMAAEPMGMCCGGANPGMVCPVVYEPMMEKCCHREIVHNVPHVTPINTRIINHHIYRHTYQPQFTYCEENDVCNVYEGRCGY